MNIEEQYNDDFIAVMKAQGISSFMTMKDLKKELDAIGANYSQCIEKNEFE